MATPDLAVGRVGIAGGIARAGLDRDLVARLHQLLAGLGHQRDAPLARGGFLGDSDAHRNSAIEVGTV